MGLDRGLLRVYGERDTDRLLGAEMCGPAAEHLSHLVAWAIESKLTVDEALRRPFYHPVLEEGLRTALRTLNHALGFESEGFAQGDYCPLPAPAAGLPSAAK